MHIWLVLSCETNILYRYIAMRQLSYEGYSFYYNCWFISISITGLCVTSLLHDSYGCHYGDFRINSYPPQLRCLSFVISVSTYWGSKSHQLVSDNHLVRGMTRKLVRCMTRWLSRCMTRWLVRGMTRNTGERHDQEYWWEAWPGILVRGMTRN